MAPLLAVQLKTTWAFPAVAVSPVEGGGTLTCGVAETSADWALVPPDGKGLAQLMIGMTRLQHRSFRKIKPNLGAAGSIPRCRTLPDTRQPSLQGKACDGGAVYASVRTIPVLSAPSNPHKKTPPVFSQVPPPPGRGVKLHCECSLSGALLLAHGVGRGDRPTKDPL